MCEYFQRVTANETKEERETRLEKQRARQARHRTAESPAQRERRLERARQAENRAAEQRERRRQYMHVWNQRVLERETAEQRARRLERLRTNYVTWSKSRATETEEQRKDRLENRRIFNARKKNVIKDKEDVMPVEPTIVIKGEPIQWNPEAFASDDKDVKNVTKDVGDTVLVGLTVIFKAEPITFGPEPSASADIVIKDEFVICSEDDTESSADVPPSTVPASHVTLSVACLGSGRKPSKSSTSADIVIKDEVVVSCEDDTGSSADVPSSTEPTSHVNLSVACLGSSQQPDSGQ
ncbi:hypothetical protein CDAR_16341 [Caerostris darwini]|uniref:Uncharacterized protein n=1 Tax=Caerostris darwini TaxID=1538125 RepID=A0AAV4WQE3_9ARAC|nr:hypothetical protein CDAR_16341 [Caerostris darwini]